ncbi:uncharacterized protein LOC135379139 [Ornithodoros turicata]|uniref:uncharacterized protein LOC135379139 n=1 Tax=Ornithodoros turicata TaxID=34597 RepID=UPI003139460A
MADCGLKTPKPLDVSSQSPNTWDDWLQSYEWYVTDIQLHKKLPEVQVANFMTVIGQDAQNVYRTLSLSDEEKKQLEVVKQRFKEHFTPKANHAYERYKFNELKQKEGETFNEFLTAARLQAKICQFGELTDELLRDRIIVGIRNDDVREKLLSDPTIDLQKTVNTCRASEQASQQLKEIANKDTKVLDSIGKKKTKSTQKMDTEMKEQTKKKRQDQEKRVPFVEGSTNLENAPHMAKLVTNAIRWDTLQLCAERAET